MGEEIKGIQLSQNQNLFNIKIKNQPNKPTRFKTAFSVSKYVGRKYSFSTICNF